MTKATTPKAIWSDKEVEELVRYFHDYRGDGADGGNFKPSVCNSAAKHLKQFLEAGPEKTGKMVKNKWSSSLRKIYMEIDSYRASVSGCHWDDTNGANIQGKDAEVVWDEYVKAHPVLRPFKNKGWPLYPSMQDILQIGGARGAGLYAGPEMEAPEAANLQDEPTMCDAMPGPFQLEATDSGLGSSGGVSDAKGKGRAAPMIPTIPSPSDEAQMTSTSSFKCIASHPATTGSRPTTTSTGKRSHSDMTGDDSRSLNMSALPFSSASQSTGPVAKKMTLSAAMATAAVAPPPRKSTSTPRQSYTAETLMLGMQGSLNLLTSSLTNSNVTTEDKVSARRAVALTILHEQDGDLPKDVKAFIRAMIAHNVGFTDVYTLTVDKDERSDFVRAEVEGMRVKSLANVLPLHHVTVPEPF